MARRGLPRSRPRTIGVGRLGRRLQEREKIFFLSLGSNSVQRRKRRDPFSLAGSMACVTRAVISANGGAFTCHRRWSLRQADNGRKLLTVSASAASTDDPDCNADECAPDKEVCLNFPGLNFFSLTIPLSSLLVDSEFCFEREI